MDKAAKSRKTRGGKPITKNPFFYISGDELIVVDEFLREHVFVPKDKSDSRQKELEPILEKFDERIGRLEQRATEQDALSARGINIEDVLLRVQILEDEIRKLSNQH